MSRTIFGSYFRQAESTITVPKFMAGGQIVSDDASTPLRSSHNPAELNQVGVVILSFSRTMVPNVLSLHSRLVAAGAAVVVVANSASCWDLLSEADIGAVTAFHNGGFSVGMNFGVKELRRIDRTLQWFVLLNDDADIPDVYAFARINGLNSRIVSYSPDKVLVIPTTGSILRSFAMVPPRYHSVPHGQQDVAIPSDCYCAFSAVGIHVTLWDELGGLDESFPFTYEDADFSRRASNRNEITVLVAESDRAVHIRGESGRFHVAEVLPVSTASALRYLDNIGHLTVLTRLAIILCLIIRIPLTPFSRASRLPHLRGIIRAIGVVLGAFQPMLPEFDAV